MVFAVRKKYSNHARAQVVVIKREFPNAKIIAALKFSNKRCSFCLQRFTITATPGSLRMRSLVIKKSNISLAAALAALLILARDENNTLIPLSRLVFIPSNYPAI